MDKKKNLEAVLADAIANAGADIDILDLPTLEAADKVLVVSGDRIGYLPMERLKPDSVLVRTDAISYGETDALYVGFSGQVFCICYIGGAFYVVERLALGNSFLDADGEETQHFTSRLKSTFVSGKVNLVLESDGILHVYGGLDSVHEPLHIRLFYIGDS